MEIRLFDKDPGTENFLTLYKCTGKTTDVTLVVHDESIRIDARDLIAALEAFLKVR